MANEPKEGWPPKNAAKLTEVADWMRRGMNVHGKGLLVLAVGENSISFAKDPNISAQDAAGILWKNLDNLVRGLERLRNEGVTRGFIQREDRSNPDAE